MTTLNASGAATLPLDATGRIRDDIACIKCEYNLRGSDPLSTCPECGTPASHSAHAGLLRYSDPRWVSELARGLLMILIALVVAILASIANALIAAAAGDDKQIIRVVFWIAIIPTMVSFTGYWLLTRPEPDHAGKPADPTSRRIVRWAQLGVLIAAVIGALCADIFMEDKFGIAARGYGLVNQALTCTAYIGTLAYLQILAGRLPDGRLLARTRSVKLGICVLTGFVVTFSLLQFVLPTLLGNRRGSPDAVFGFILVGLGVALVVLALYFGIWSLILLLRFRSRFAKAAAQAAGRTQ